MDNSSGITARWSLSEDNLKALESLLAEVDTPDVQAEPEAEGLEVQPDVAIPTLDRSPEETPTGSRSLVAEDASSESSQGEVDYSYLSDVDFSKQGIGLDVGSLFEPAAEGFVGVLESKPARAVMGLLSLGTSVPIGAYDALRAESGERFTAFKESIKSARGYSDILREHDVDNFWLGFMLDMALDPTTYLSFGVLGVTKVPGKGGKMIQKVIASNAAGGRLIGKKSIMGAGLKPLTGVTQLADGTYQYALSPRGQKLYNSLLTGPSKLTPEQAGEYVGRLIDETDDGIKLVHTGGWRYGIPNPARAFTKIDPETGKNVGKGLFEGVEFTANGHPLGVLNPANYNIKKTGISKRGRALDASIGMLAGLDPDEGFRAAREFDFGGRLETGMLRRSRSASAMEEFVTRKVSPLVSPEVFMSRAVSKLGPTAFKINSFMRSRRPIFEEINGTREFKEADRKLWEFHLKDYAFSNSTGKEALDRLVKQSQVSKATYLQQGNVLDDSFIRAIDSEAIRIHNLYKKDVELPEGEEIRSLKEIKDELANHIINHADVQWDQELVGDLKAADSEIKAQLRTVRSKLNKQVGDIQNTIEHNKLMAEQMNTEDALEIEGMVHAIRNDEVEGVQSSLHAAYVEALNARENILKEYDKVVGRLDALTDNNPDYSFSSLSLKDDMQSVIDDQNSLINSGDTIEGLDFEAADTDLFKPQDVPTQYQGPEFPDEISQSSELRQIEDEIKSTLLGEAAARFRTQSELRYNIDRPLFEASQTLIPKILNGKIARQVQKTMPKKLGVGQMFRDYMGPISIADANRYASNGSLRRNISSNFLDKMIGIYGVNNVGIDFDQELLDEGLKRMEASLRKANRVKNDLLKGLQPTTTWRGQTVVLNPEDIINSARDSLSVKSATSMITNHRGRVLSHLMDVTGPSPSESYNQFMDSIKGIEKEFGRGGNFDGQELFNTSPDDLMQLNSRDLSTYVSRNELMKDISSKLGQTKRQLLDRIGNENLTYFQVDQYEPSSPQGSGLVDSPIVNMHSIGLPAFKSMVDSLIRVTRGEGDGYIDLLDNIKVGVGGNQFKSHTFEGPDGKTYRKTIVDLNNGQGIFNPEDINPDSMLIGNTTVLDRFMDELGWDKLFTVEGLDDVQGAITLGDELDNPVYESFINHFVMAEEPVPVEGFNGRYSDVNSESVAMVPSSLFENKNVTNRHRAAEFALMEVEGITPAMAKSIMSNFEQVEAQGGYEDFQDLVMKRYGFDMDRPRSESSMTYPVQFNKIMFGDQPSLPGEGFGQLSEVSSITTGDSRFMSDADIESLSMDMEIPKKLIDQYPELEVLYKHKGDLPIYQDSFGFTHSKTDVLKGGKKVDTIYSSHQNRALSTSKRLREDFVQSFKDKDASLQKAFETYRADRFDKRSPNYDPNFAFDLMDKLPDGHPFKTFIDNYVGSGGAAGIFKKIAPDLKTDVLPGMKWNPDFDKLELTGPADLISFQSELKKHITYDTESAYSFIVESSWRAFVDHKESLKRSWMNSPDEWDRIGLLDNLYDGAKGPNAVQFETVMNAVHDKYKKFWLDHYRENPSAIEAIRLQGQMGRAGKASLTLNTSRYSSTPILGNKVSDNARLNASGYDPLSSSTEIARRRIKAVMPSSDDPNKLEVKFFDVDHVTAEDFSPQAMVRWLLDETQPENPQEQIPAIMSRLRRMMASGDQADLDTGVIESGVYALYSDKGQALINRLMSFGNQIGNIEFALNDDIDKHLYNAIKGKYIETYGSDHAKASYITPEAIHGMINEKRLPSELSGRVERGEIDEEGLEVLTADTREGARNVGATVNVYNLGGKSNRYAQRLEGDLAGLRVNKNSQLVDSKGKKVEAKAGGLKFVLPANFKEIAETQARKFLDNTTTYNDVTGGRVEVDKTPEGEDVNAHGLLSGGGFSHNNDGMINRGVRLNISKVVTNPETQVGSSVFDGVLASNIPDQTNKKLKLSGVIDPTLDLKYDSNLTITDLLNAEGQGWYSTDKYKWREVASDAPSEEIGIREVLVNNDGSLVDDSQVFRDAKEAAIDVDDLSEGQQWSVRKRKQAARIYDESDVIIVVRDKIVDGEFNHHAELGLDEGQYRGNMLAVPKTYGKKSKPMLVIDIEDFITKAGTEDGAKTMAMNIAKWIASKNENLRTFGSHGGVLSKEASIKSIGIIDDSAVGRNRYPKEIDYQKDTRRPSSLVFQHLFANLEGEYIDRTPWHRTGLKDESKNIRLNAVKDKKGKLTKVHQVAGNFGDDIYGFDGDKKRLLASGGPIEIDIGRIDESGNPVMKTIEFPLSDDGSPLDMSLDYAYHVIAKSWDKDDSVGELLDTAIRQAPGAWGMDGSNEFLSLRGRKDNKYTTSELFTAIKEKERNGRVTRASVNDPSLDLSNTERRAVYTGLLKHYFEQDDLKVPIKVYDDEGKVRWERVSPRSELEAYKELTKSGDKQFVDHYAILSRKNRDNGVSPAYALSVLVNDQSDLSIKRMSSLVEREQGVADADDLFSRYSKYKDDIEKVQKALNGKRSHQVSKWMEMKSYLQKKRSAIMASITSDQTSADLDKVQKQINNLDMLKPSNYDPYEKGLADAVDPVSLTPDEMDSRLATIDEGINKLQDAEGNVNFSIDYSNRLTFHEMFQYQDEKAKDLAESMGKGKLKSPKEYMSRPAEMNVYRKSLDIIDHVANNMPVNEISNLDDTGDIKVLIDLMHNKNLDNPLRVHATEILASLGSDKITAMITKSLKDQDSLFSFKLAASYIDNFNLDRLRSLRNSSKLRRASLGNFKGLYESIKDNMSKSEKLSAHIDSTIVPEPKMILAEMKEGGGTVTLIDLHSQKVTPENSTDVIDFWMHRHGNMMDQTMYDIEAILELEDNLEAQNKIRGMVKEKPKTTIKALNHIASNNDTVKGQKAAAALNAIVDDSNEAAKKALAADGSPLSTSIVENNSPVEHSDVGKPSQEIESVVGDESNIELEYATLKSEDESLPVDENNLKLPTEDDIEGATPDNVESWTLPDRYVPKEQEVADPDYVDDYSSEEMMDQAVEATTEESIPNSTGRLEPEPEYFTEEMFDDFGFTDTYDDSFDPLPPRNPQSDGGPVGGGGDGGEPPSPP